METGQDLESSLPYIDDVPTDEESNPHPYNLRIFENYQDKNRNIEIINKCPEDVFGKSLSPVAPLAEERETSDPKGSDSQEESVKNATKQRLRKQNGMRLVIKGCNSSISIQGLDNRSSITFKRPQQQRKLRQREERNQVPGENAKPQEKPRKGRWKMLTRSLITKSGRFERKGADERYPKYVLLKNEEEDAPPVKENYPKMFVFKEKSSECRKQKDSEFNFKKPFKNKTQPMEEIPANEGGRKPKKPETKKTLRGGKTPIRENAARNDPEATADFPGCPSPRGEVFNEIQGVFQDTLKLCPGIRPPEEFGPKGKPDESSTSLPEFSCRDPYCCFLAHQPPKYIPVYDAPIGAGHSYKPSNVRTDDRDVTASGPRGEPEREEDVDLKNLPFGLLSSFFPRVVIVKTFQTDDEEGVKTEDNDLTLAEDGRGRDGERKEDEHATETLEVPQSDLTIKSKMVGEVPKAEVAEFYQSESSLQCDHSNESEATEYLHYSESEQLGNESVEKSNSPSPPPKCDTRGDKKPNETPDQNPKDLSLTKIGYKMYDNLTKLSLNRDREIVEKAEATGRGRDGNEPKSPYNITLESRDGVLKVTVPENEFNFQIVNSRGGDIQIGVTSRGKEGREEKTLVRKDELWHPDEGRKAFGSARDEAKGSQKLKVSLAGDKEVLFSIEMSERERRGEEAGGKPTEEKKIGTDDFDLAGGDSAPVLGENCKNLSPRRGRLLKNLQQKLELGERERRFLAEKINERLTDQKFQGKIHPGIFMVRQIGAGVKKPFQVPPKKKEAEAEAKDSGGRLREYYCEECLATMRIFEDENPSVKTMVDKFETIIQLESY